ncbi:uncharacterized protein LOC126679182 isoform X1 [Mercurialis annua]|uniref:uncharacterized protein LOC126679182 isoform X1 n=1 Tax=Mercurialis annua TaxID=3986 RepID=UPI00215E1DF3|nr:uncharacterized protein LOC126679182 isoform X1 [Mercurialis annua]XP_050230106.1 uncharacterized protein LOC126679182 isoform X1 [Mercurialis annua]XP_050230107.1 uncharacterized protein LOC126679182 isoform X1 [Mercurialis annua]XP_050230109.1 uncharacterized protein LOC126679182 isoform X1 [Mercurialis annua]XP_050230110.1 uncharacterized protein LOC126679182 isoform X1 [Mercurialis annua]XP_050230113.1 uncharacterized protein LOC126679182 isoform X1 [Mercurialis annua]
MDLSEDWKSGFPIGIVFDPPLLLSDSAGPLFFNPNPNSLTQLFNSPLFPPILNPPPNLSLSRFIATSTAHDAPIPDSTASAIASVFGPQFHDEIAETLLGHNHLQFLKIPLQNDVLVFFSTGLNHDQVGFLLLSVKDGSLCAVGDSKGGVFVADKDLNQKIVGILVNPDGDFEGNASVIGYLLVFTTYSVHWFCVKSGERPVVSYVGGKVFKSCSVVDACWSPHLSKESVVLLENGQLFLFDLKSDQSDSYFRGTMLKVLWDGSGKSRNCRWLGCEFSWHPRILIVARSDAVFLVDWRYDVFKVTSLAKIDMFGRYAPAEKEFLAFSKAVSDHFHFVLASNNMLVLCDVRKPLRAVLQWAHGLDNPCYIDVCRLSELRSNSINNEHEWATDSGFGIILGSFWNCEFSLFCYGPSLPARKGSIALEISEISKSSYAWELPSDLLLSGNKCRCGNCLVREEFLKDSLPEWIDWQQKKERILGFGILSKDLSSLLFESDEYGGFTLIRLMSSGKLELQRYYASWDLVTKLEEGHRDPLLCNEDNLLFSLDNEKYRFPKIFKYLKLDYLSAYINGNLLQALDLNLIKTCEDPQQKESFSIEFHEILCEKLNTCGFGKFRTFPAINAVFNNINLPTSVHEVAMSSMWASLPMELLQLAFSSYNEFLEALLDQKKVALEFLDVPDIPQLPPFFLRKPSSRSSKWSSKVPRSEVLVGPVIPLPILITLHELRNGCPNSQEGFSRFSSEIELNNQCKEVMQVARVMAMPDSTIELRDHDDDDAVSLGDDRDDIWADSEKPKPLCLYRPVAELGSVEGHKESKSVHKDDKFGFMLAKVHAKDPKNNKKMESMGQELFDDLCPIHMKFDAADMEFSSKEMKAYNSLKREFSKWQEGFKPFQGFRDRFEN